MCSIKQARRVFGGVAIAVGGLSTAPANAWEGTLRFDGQGTFHTHIWCFPNLPPHQPTIGVDSDTPVAQFTNPCNDQTLLMSQGSSAWQQHTRFESVRGDTVDWHSMLPFVHPSSLAAVGSLDVTVNNITPHTADYHVTWSGSDPGVAMHLGWFDTTGGGRVLLHEELRIGPWSEINFIVHIVTPNNMMDVDFESSGAAVSLAPCGSADFDCDGDLGTDADIEAFFACLAGACPTPPCWSNADFNSDGDLGTDADIEAFFRVLAGGTC